jgi:hypothetical protein
MKLRSKQQLIANIAQAVRSRIDCAYRTGADPAALWIGGRWAEDVHQELCDKKPQTCEAIAAILGDNSWTQNQCDECGKDCDVTVRLGEEPDYDSTTFYACPDCLRAALDLITKKS